MSKNVKTDFSIEVDKTVRQVLDLLTRKREFKLVTTNLELSQMQMEMLLGARSAWCEVRDIGEEGESDEAERRYLVVGNPVASRDTARVTGPFIDPELHAFVLESETGYCTVEFFPVEDLYERFEGKTLRFIIQADAEDEANRIWLREMLRLGTDPGKWYRCDDSSSITVSLQRFAKNVEGKPASEGAVGVEPEPVDIADFEVYDRLYGKLERMARDYCYGDDIFVEYSICSDEGVARYCATEFYSNHNWNADPANLFVMRFFGQIAPGECSPRDVQFSHPTKATERKADRERFLVDALVMTNDVRVKFYSGRGEERHPDETVSADRVLDSFVDFDMWVEMYRKEVQLD